MEAVAKLLASKGIRTISEQFVTTPWYRWRQKLKAIANHDICCNGPVNLNGYRQKEIRPDV